MPTSHVQIQTALRQGRLELHLARLQLARTPRSESAPRELARARYINAWNTLRRIIRRAEAHLCRDPRPISSWVSESVRQQMIEDLDAA